MEKLFKDTKHNFLIKTTNKRNAWIKVRNKCKELGLEVPNVSEIIEV